MAANLPIGGQIHRFTWAQYEQMIDAGVFGPGDRLELLDGEIIDMAPQKSRHATAVRLLEEVLRTAFGQGYDVRAQLPFRADEHSEPEPDIAVVPGAPRDYRDAHPSRAALIVEVADTTLAYDRIRKLGAYARADVPEYWILDLNSETLEVCRKPIRDAYAERRILGAGDRIAPALAAREAFAVSDILP